MARKRYHKPWFKPGEAPTYMAARYNEAQPVFTKMWSASVPKISRNWKEAMEFIIGAPVKPERVEKLERAIKFAAEKGFHDLATRGKGEKLAKEYIEALAAKTVA